MALNRKDPDSSIPIIEKRLDALEGKKENNDVDRINKDLKRASNRLVFVEEAVDEMPDLAKEEVSKYITEIDDGGIKVHPENDTVNYILIDSDSVDVIKGNKVMASYGSNVTIGVSDDYHMNVESTRIDGCDSENNPKFSLAYVYDINTSYGRPNDKCAVFCGDNNYILISPRRPSHFGFVDENGHSIEAVDTFAYSHLKLGEHKSLLSACNSYTSGSGATYKTEASVSLESGDDGVSTATITATDVNIDGSLKVNNTSVSLEGHTHTAKTSGSSSFITAADGVTITNHCSYNATIKMFVLNIAVAMTGASAGTWTKVGTVGANYRPPYKMALNATHNAVTSNSNTHGIWSYIDTDGSVYVKRSTTVTGAFTTYVSGTYLI